MPLDSFSETRNFLLKTSALILQDDSGIPFHDFHSDLWKVQLFGVYVEPLTIFKVHKEPELEAAYHSGEYSGLLPFGAGYHVNARDANLILATRIDVRPDSVALPSVITPMPLLTPTPAPAHTPKPRRIRIRKALPVEIRRALPVNAPPTVPITLSEPSQEIQLPQPTDAPRIEAAPEVMVIPEAAPLR